MIFKSIKSIFQKYINNLINITRKKTFKNTTIVFISNVTNRVLGFFTFILLAKHLSVADYGILAVLLAFIVTVTDLINSGLNASVIRYVAVYKAQNDYEKIWKLFSTALINLVGLSVVLIIAFFFLSDSIASLLFKNRYGSFVVISSFGILTTFIFSVFSGLFQGLQWFNRLFIVSSSFSLTKLLLILILIYYKSLSLLSILIAFIASPIIGVLLGLVFIKSLKVTFFLYDFKIMRETFTFGKWIILWSIVSIIQSKLDIYLLSPLSKPEQVSYFDMAQKFVSIIMVGIAAYSTVLNPKLASINGFSNLCKEMKKAKIISFFVSVLLIAGVFIAPIVIRICFNTKYECAIVPLKIMLVSLVPFVWCLPFNSALFAIGKSNVFFFTALIGLVVNSILSFTLIPRYGAIGSSISYASLNVMGLIITLIFFNKYFKEKYITT